GVRGERTEGSDSKGLPSGSDRREADALPIGNGQEGSPHGDRLSEAISEHSESPQVELPEALQHVNRQPARDHRLFELIAVAQQRGGQRLEAVHAERVERAGSDPAQVGLSVRHVVNDALLETGPGYAVFHTPVVDNVDSHRSKGARSDALDEVRDGG